MFLPIASTGRTATSYIAEALNHVPGVVGLHEGHLGNDSGPDVLPMVNLDNFQCYKSPERAAAVVASKRNREILDAARNKHGGRLLVDVAYYNSVLITELLRQMPEIHAAFIIRDCESFVRSATWFTGTDPMPVGWPDPEKPLDAREKFVAMGRIRPTAVPDAEAWSIWGAVERNIWLWRETNRVLCRSWEEFPDRVHHLDFRQLVADPASELNNLLTTIGSPLSDDQFGILRTSLEEAHTRQNERHGGYQLGPSDQWTAVQRQMLVEAQDEVDERTRRMSNVQR
jgi:hypothetical protein